jgi:hypothetical protein
MQIISDRGAIVPAFSHDSSCPHPVGRSAPLRASHFCADSSGRQQICKQVTELLLSPVRSSKIHKV